MLDFITQGWKQKPLSRACCTSLFKITSPSNFPQVLKDLKLLNLFENKAESKVNANLVLWAVVSKGLARTPQASLILSPHLEQRHKTQHALHTHQRL